MFEKHKVYAFIGMFGSGKTEIAINASLKMKESYEKVAIADIDTISPYFRTRDEFDYLSNQGIKVLTPPARYMKGDLPIIDPSVGGFITNPDYKTVLDVGGNDFGAIVMSSLNNFVKSVDTATCFVVNIRRPFTDSEEKIKENLIRLSQKARVNITYLINNSNLMDETDQETVSKGEKIIESVSKDLNIPILCTVISEEISDNIETKFLKFPIKRFMKKIWD